MTDQAALAFLSSPLSRFKPWRTKAGLSPQGEFLRAVGSHNVVLFRAANRSGKSVGGAVNVALLGCGLHPYRKLPRGSAIWVVTLDWEAGVGQVIWPHLKRWLPRDRVAISWLRRTGVEIPNAITFKDTGITLAFKSAESSREKFQGAKLAYAWIDEEIDGNVVQEVRARLLDLGGGLSITLTPIARKGWVQDLEREKDEAGQPTTKVIRASMRDAAEAIIVDEHGVTRPMLNPIEVDRYLRSLPERERRVREFGDYGSLEGLVYPDFDASLHVLRPDRGWLRDAKGLDVYPWPLPTSWPRYAAIDFGYTNPTAVLLAAEDPFSGRLIVYRCLWGAGVTISRWSEVFMQELPELATPMVADHDAMQRAELAEAGFPTTAARKDIVQGIEAVSRSLWPRPDDGKPSLYLVREPSEEGPRLSLTGTRCDADRLVWELQGYRYPERKDGKPDPKDHPVKRDDHACFAGSVRVRTPDGWVRIDSLPREVVAWDPLADAYVRARCFSGMNGNRRLVKLTFDDAVEVLATDRHPFLTSAGWLPAAGLQGSEVMVDDSPDGEWPRPTSVSSTSTRALLPTLIGRFKRRLVVEVDDAGWGDVFNLKVPSLGYFLAEGCVVSNCDALRYLWMSYSARGASAPELPDRDPGPRPFDDAVPPSPWPARK